jgi:hypothetical protein
MSPRLITCRKKLADFRAVWAPFQITDFFTKGRDFG